MRAFDDSRMPEVVASTPVAHSSGKISASPTKARGTTTISPSVQPVALPPIVLSAPVHARTEGRTLRKLSNVRVRCLYASRTDELARL